ncbi:MAG: acyl-CoA dehydrogenase [Syntrophomonadaceae bacterium]|jgi:alkylation response protein AidB-like acyl-CoA dehydrogenase|nr:acyl-CoA dehydrogenase [Syntrophomonadaceae bacterium]
MDFKLTKEQELIQKAAKEFAEKSLMPIADKIAEDNKVPPEIIEEMADLGFLGIQFPEEYGGTGAGYTCYPLVLEQIARAASGVAMVLSVNALGASAIYAFGTPEQKEKYLPECCTGKKLASFAFTEPATGSDPKQITTTAVQDGDYYVINGTKRFISLADLDGPIVIFAKDNETGKPTAFIVEKNCPGYSTSEQWNKIGNKGGSLVDVYLKDVRVPAANLLGPKGNGYGVLQYGIAFGKVGVCSSTLGGMQAALELSIKYAKEKAHRDGTIAKFPTIQVAIAKIAEKVEAARWLTYRLGYLAENMKDPRAFAKEAALTKAFVTEAGVDVSRLAMGIHGSYGLMDDYKVSTIYRDMIIGEQIEGVNDMQRMITAGSLLA